VKRRDFITLLGGSAVAWPLAARGQQPGRKIVKLGFLQAFRNEKYQSVRSGIAQRRIYRWPERAGLRRLAILASVGNPASVLESGQVQVAARTFDIEVAEAEAWWTTSVPAASRILRRTVSVAAIVTVHRGLGV
jgi:hypothetical protein